MRHGLATMGTNLTMDVKEALMKYCEKKGVNPSIKHYFPHSNSSKSRSKRRQKEVEDVNVQK